MKKNPVIDVHHHWMPEEHYEHPEPFVHPEERLVREPERFRVWRGEVQLFSPPRLTARIDDQIKIMDRSGVDMTVLHIGVWLEWVDLKAARFINDRMAEITARHPGRIIPLAHVPPLDPEGRAELKRAIVDKGFAGVGVNTHINGVLLDDERLYPFYQAVSDLEVPIVVHPSSQIFQAHPHGMEQFNLTRNLGRAFDTTINIVRLMLSGTMDRFPRLRFVFSHMGGAYFAIKNRLNPGHFDKRGKRFFDKYKKRIFIDTAPPFWTPEEIRFAVQMMGEGQVLLGSDFPTIGLLKNSVTIVQKAKLTPQVKRKLLGGNAQKLFRLR